MAAALLNCISTPANSPRSASSRRAASRREGEGAPGSSRAARASSVVVMVSLQITGECRAMESKMSPSRTIKSLLVAMAAPHW